MTPELIGKILEYGMGGAFIVYLIYDNQRLKKENKANNLFIQKQGVEVTKMIGNMGNVMKTLMTKTTTLPEDLKKELDPSFSKINSGINELKITIKAQKQ